MFMISRNANGFRAREVRHAVDHARANGNLGRLRIDTPCLPVVTRKSLEAIHRVLRERAPMIAAAVLPFAAANSGDRLDRAVAPRRPRRLCRLMNRALAWRNRGRCAARGDRSGAWLGVKGPITADDIEQFDQDVAIGNVLVRHRGGTNLTGVRVEPEMYLAPHTTLRYAPYLHVPFRWLSSGNMKTCPGTSVDRNRTIL